MTIAHFPGTSNPSPTGLPGNQISPSSAFSDARISVSAHRAAVEGTLSSGDGDETNMNRSSPDTHFAHSRQEDVPSMLSYQVEGMGSSHLVEGGGSEVDEATHKSSSRKNTTAEQVGGPVLHFIASRQDFRLRCQALTGPRLVLKHFNSLVDGRPPL